MLKLKYLLFTLVVILLGSACLYAAAPDQPEDEVCQKLFQEYVASPSMLHTGEDVYGVDLLATRGYSRSFWKPVLMELRKGKSNEPACIKILGTILGFDAIARASYERQKGITDPRQMEQAAWHVCLPSEVLPEILERAQNAEGKANFGYYLIALSRARDKRCEDLFLKVIRGKDSQYNTRYKFTSAVGLADLGNSEGMEWLIANCDDDISQVRYSAQNMALDDACVSILQQFVLWDKQKTWASYTKPKTRSDFEEWWKRVQKPFVINYPVQLDFH